MFSFRNFQIVRRFFQSNNNKPFGLVGQNNFPSNFAKLKNELIENLSKAQGALLRRDESSASQVCSILTKLRRAENYNHLNEAVGDWKNYKHLIDLANKFETDRKLHR